MGFGMLMGALLQGKKKGGSIEREATFVKQILGCVLGCAGRLYGVR